MAADGLAFLGIVIDPDLNTEASGDREVGLPGSSVRSLVIEAREEVQISSEVRQVLSAG
jgi:acetate kinase